MDQLERKHYEQKVNLLDEQIKQAYTDGSQVSMDRLMRKVGLSPRLKDRFDKKVVEINGIADLTSGSKPFEPQSIKSRRTTEKKAIASNMVPYLLSPSHDIEMEDS